MIFYDFEFYEKFLKLFKGDILIDFENGFVKLYDYDDEGFVVRFVDLIDVFNGYKEE